MQQIQEETMRKNGLKRKKYGVRETQIHAIDNGGIIYMRAYAISLNNNTYGFITGEEAGW